MRSVRPFHCPSCDASLKAPTVRECALCAVALIDAEGGALFDRDDFEDAYIEELLKRARVSRIKGARDGLVRVSGDVEFLGGVGPAVTSVLSQPFAIRDKTAQARIDEDAYLLRGQEIHQGDRVTIIGEAAWVTTEANDGHAYRSRAIEVGMYLLFHGTFEAPLVFINQRE